MVTEIKLIDPWYIRLGTNFLACVYNSYQLVIGVHEIHGRMHPNYWQITILLVVDLYSSLAYFMMTQPLPIAGKLPIKTLVAKQLPTSYVTVAIIPFTYMYAVSIVYMHMHAQCFRYST